MRALGLMSGTSLDGIDVAFLETDGEDVVQRGPAMTFPYSAEMRALLAQAISDARHMKGRSDRAGVLGLAEREVTERHAAAVSQFLGDRGIARASIDVVGFHGQTVLHRHQAHRSITVTESCAVLDTPHVVASAETATVTVQLGLGDALAEMIGLPVVYDLRAADVAAGGEGAPLVPIYHRALTAALRQRPLAIVNIGGVSNVTWIGRDGRLAAFDTGPGNALIDDWVRAKTGKQFDVGGALAAKGEVEEMVVSKYLSDPFFHALGPKSLDRNAFDLDLIAGLSLEDGAATLANLTARAIATATSLVPERPEMWVICGGGRRNKALMAMLAGLVDGAVVPAEAAGLDGDSVEAEAWAYLAVRSLKGLPITFPGTTGVPQPMTGGVLATRKPGKPQ